MTNRSCSTCDYCVQYRVSGAYPEFGCMKKRGIRLNGMRFPSEKESCEQWELIRTNKWKLKHKEMVR